MNKHFALLCLAFILLAQQMWAIREDDEHFLAEIEDQEEDNETEEEEYLDMTSLLQQSCYANSYNRGYGYPKPDCEVGEYQSGAICYAPCKAGYEPGFSIFCKQKCPFGFQDGDSVCVKPKPYPRVDKYALMEGCVKDHDQGCEKQGMYYSPKCNPGFILVGSNLCQRKCPEGMRDLGISCNKRTYIRTSKRTVQCPHGLESSGHLCYPPCKQGYYGVGPECWAKCPKGLIACGAFCLRGHSCDATLLERNKDVVASILRIPKSEIKTTSQYKQVHTATLTSNVANSAKGNETVAVHGSLKPMLVARAVIRASVPISGQYKLFSASSGIRTCDVNHEYLPRHNYSSLPLFPNMKVYIRSSHSTYLRANDNKYYVSLVPHSKTNEEWTIVLIGSGKIAFRSIWGTYLRAWPDGYLDQWPHCGAREHWTPKVVNGKLAFKSNFNSYLSALPTGKLKLVNYHNDWELWTVVPK